jgi:hypothetical protein
MQATAVSPPLVPESSAPHAGVDPASLEASVRVQAGRWRGGRMMIERATPAQLYRIADAHGVTLAPPGLRVLESVARASLPLIAGWDVGDSGRTIVKAYANASDHGLAARAGAEAHILGRVLDPAAHVVGVNLFADGRVERKRYVQAPDAEAVAAPFGPRARDLARAAVRAGASAGAVVSFDVPEGDASPVPRAFFVAVRATGWSALARALPWFDAPTFAAQLPFAPGVPRSVGVSLAGELAYTVYVKPAGAGPALHALEGDARFRAPGVVLSLFVEPAALALRSFRRTASHALSYRVVEGHPEPALVDGLFAWALGRVHAAESARRPVSEALAEDAPPPPWSRA